MSFLAMIYLFTPHDKNLSIRGKSVQKNQFSDCKKSDLVKDAGSIKTETNYKKEHFKPAIAFFVTYGYGQYRTCYYKDK